MIKNLNKCRVKVHFDAVINVSTNALGLYVAFNFAYAYLGKYGKNQLTGALISVDSFIMLIPQNMSTVSGDTYTATAGLNSLYIGETGLFVAILVGWLSAFMYVKLSARGLGLKCQIVFQQTSKNRYHHQLFH